jgi:hypothetical protein
MRISIDAAHYSLSCQHKPCQCRTRKGVKPGAGDLPCRCMRNGKPIAPRWYNKSSCCSARSSLSIDRDPLINGVEPTTKLPTRRSPTRRSSLTGEFTPRKANLDACVCYPACGSNNHTPRHPDFLPILPQWWTAGGGRRLYCACVDHDSDLYCVGNMGYVYTGPEISQPYKSSAAPLGCYQLGFDRHVWDISPERSLQTRRVCYHEDC